MDVFKKTSQCIIGTYKRFEVAFDKGEGIYLYDTKKDRYLDFLAGIAVNALGHSHKIIQDAIVEQSQKLIHVSNLYHIKEQAELACYLSDISVLDKAFFCNSGAEANEAAIKLARLYGKGERYKIISMKNSFHGRTMSTLSATGQIKYHKGFEPMLGGFDFAEFNDFNDAKDKIDEKTCAVMVEFVQGEGGINVAERVYIDKLYDYCKSKDILFIADEIQTGIGRTGRFFSYEHYGVEPDIVTLSKALGGGIPIGAMLAKDDVAQYFTFGTHGSTFGGSPLASYVSLQVVKYINESGLMASVENLGDYLIEKLNEIAAKSNMIIGISGLGLMVGIKMKDAQSADELVIKMLDNRVLVGKAGDATVRIEPPLIVEKKHIDEFLSILESLVL
jgi:acetylornithine/N-succinyldiaminopimelate aminotransferase